MSETSFAPFTGQKAFVRPLQQYGNFILLTHLPYQNYNSMQVSYQKQSGPVTFIANYTFSKVLGIRDGGSNNGPRTAPASILS